MKLILDCDVEYMGSALTLFFRTMSQNPTQKVGRGSSITEVIGDKRFEVIKNLDSYTVRQYR